MTQTPRKHHGRTIDTTVTINTTADRAWRAWTDPQQIANWFVDRAEGVATPGEVMTWFFDTFNYQMPVPIVEAEPGKTFVTGSGDVPGPQGLPYLMEITIAQDGGATTVRLVNSGFSEDATFDDEYEGVVSGWKMALATMKEWLERYPEQDRVHRIVLQPATYTAERLQPLFHTIDGRRRWLEPLLPADSPVLTDTGRELLLQWKENAALLGIKAFRMGPQQMVALDYSASPDHPGDVEHLGADLQQAVERLTKLLSSPG